MGGSSSRYITSLISLVNIFFCIVIVLFLICHVNPTLRMCKGLCEYMGGSPHGESPHFDIGLVQMGI